MKRLSRILVLGIALLTVPSLEVRSAATQGEKEDSKVAVLKSCKQKGLAGAMLRKCQREEGRKVKGKEDFEAEEDWSESEEEGEGY